MNGSTTVLVVLIAVGVGYAVGKMPWWKTWTGYVGLVIVAPIAIVSGVPMGEVLIDCAGLGVGFALARR